MRKLARLGCVALLLTVVPSCKNLPMMGEAQAQASLIPLTIKTSTAVRKFRVEVARTEDEQARVGAQRLRGLRRERRAPLLERRARVRGAVGEDPAGAALRMGDGQDARHAAGEPTPGRFAANPTIAPARQQAAPARNAAR